MKMYGYPLKHRCHAPEIHPPNTVARSRAPHRPRMNPRTSGYGEFVAPAARGKRAANCEFAPLP